MNRHPLVVQIENEHHARYAASLNTQRKGTFAEDSGRDIR